MPGFRLAHQVRSSLWLVPALCVIAGVGLSLGTIALDRLLGPGFLPQSLTGGPDAALFILSAVATSMVTLAALVLTITMVVVQLAMGQFSPRIVRTILQDTTSQVAIGVFVGTFAHAMLTMREVAFDGPEGGSVPGIAIVMAFVLVIASIILLVFYVHHLGQSLRVAALIELVGSEMRDLVDAQYPSGAESAHRPAPGTVPAARSGVVFHIDHPRLVAAARDAGCTVELVPALGDFAPAGAPLLRVDPPDAPLDPDAVDHVQLGPERTMNQDLAYGMRMLVDIAERGLSEPFLDPTTAVQALDRLHDCLRQLVHRPFPDGRYRDADGVVRFVMPVMDWDGYVRLAFDEIREAGRTSPQVPRRLAAAVDDLLAIAPPERRAALERQRALLDAEAVGDPPVADPQGIGSGRDALRRVSLNGDDRARRDRAGAPGP